MLKKFLTLLGINKNSTSEKHNEVQNLDIFQTTAVGSDPKNNRKNKIYNVATLNEIIKEHPRASFPRYMLAEILLDKGDISNARKEFMKAQKDEQKYKQYELTQEEIKLKKIAKAKLEKKIGYKL